ncbi:hypothetical protein, partial [Neisseria meningitidis]|uniref:hypothetical protein n=1 Tax=Neisseria meningitidis TaxID=487 RepID=UPI0012902C09
TNTGTAQDGQGNGLLEQVLKKDGNTLFLSDYKRSDGSGDKGWPYSPPFTNPPLPKNAKNAVRKPFGRHFRVQISRRLHAS